MMMFNSSNSTISGALKSATHALSVTGGNSLVCYQVLDVNFLTNVANYRYFHIC